MFPIYYILYKVYSYGIDEIRRKNTLFQFVFILGLLHW